MEANVRLGELQQKIKRLEGLCQVSIGLLKVHVAHACTCIMDCYVCYSIIAIIKPYFAFHCFLCAQELRQTESTLRTERDQWRDQATANKHEVEKLRGT